MALFNYDGTILDKNICNTRLTLKLWKIVNSFQQQKQLERMKHILQIFICIKIQHCKLFLTLNTKPTFKVRKATSTLHF